MEFLNQELLLGFTAREIIIAAIVIMIVWGPVKKLLGGKKQDRAHLVKKKCRGCTWSGPAGKETKRCPKCRGPLVAID